MAFYSNKFNNIANPYAPIYGDPKWSDLRMGLLEFEDQVIEQLNIKHSNIIDIFKSVFNEKEDRLLKEIIRSLSNHNDNQLCLWFNTDMQQLNIFKNEIKSLCNSVQYSTNCWQYAVNNSNIHSIGRVLDPNNTNPKNPSQAINNTKRAGLEYMGRELPQIKKDHYRIALAFREVDGKDYHYIRESQIAGFSRPVWSHKIGQLQEINHDNNYKVIQHPDAGDYENYKLIGYFQVPSPGLKLKLPDHLSY